MGDTSIAWTEKTWNPTVGCDQISPGCAKCYAKTLHDKRHKAYLAGKAMAPQYAQPFEVLQAIDSRLDAPLHWRTPKLVFVNSVSDLFHEDVPRDFIVRVWAVMQASPQHTFQVLTKRIERAKAILSDPTFEADVEEANDAIAGERGWCHAHGDRPFPLSNVWLGVSVENQHFADERIPLLLQTPAAVRFISAEPLLGHLNLSPFLDPKYISQGGRQWIGAGGIHWVIFGGESGTGARGCEVHWIRSGVRDCRSAGVAPYVKQLGAKPIGWWSNSLGPRIGTLRDRKGGDPEEWPIDLRVREYPAAR